MFSRGRSLRDAGANGRVRGRKMRTRAILAVCVAASLSVTAGTAAASTSSLRRTVAKSASSGLVPIGHGLKGPKGASAAIYATGLKNVSDLAYDTSGNVWASVTGDPGEKSTPSDGVYLIKSGRPVAVLTGSQVKLPIGIVWDKSTLIVSDYGYVEAWSGFDGQRFKSHKILYTGLAAGASGWTDNGAVGPDGKIYMNIGAACDICKPTGKLEADVISFMPNGTGLRVVATRVRGNTFSEFMPGTDALFGVMDQQNALVPAPDDQLGIFKQGQNWGFPTCYGQGGAKCKGIAEAVAYLPPHNGSSSMALVDGQFGPTYATSAFVSAFSLGDVERVALRKQGGGYKSSGVYQFITGLEQPDGLLVTKDDSLLVGNRVSGDIYEIKINQKTNPGASGRVTIKIPKTVQGKVPKKSTK